MWIRVCLLSYLFYFYFKNHEIKKLIFKHLFQDLAWTVTRYISNNGNRERKGRLRWCHRRMLEIIHSLLIFREKGAKTIAADVIRSSSTVRLPQLTFMLITISMRRSSTLRTALIPSTHNPSRSNCHFFFVHSCNAAVSVIPPFSIHYTFTPPLFTLSPILV